MDAIADPEIKGLYNGPIASGPDFPGYREAISFHRPALQNAYKAAFEHVDAVIFPTCRHVAAKIEDSGA